MCIYLSVYIHIHLAIAYVRVCVNACVFMMAALSSVYDLSEKKNNWFFIHCNCDFLHTKNLVIFVLRIFISLLMSFDRC